MCGWVNIANSSVRSEKNWKIRHYRKLAANAIALAVNIIKQNKKYYFFFVQGNWYHLVWGGRQRSTINIDSLPIG